MIIVGLIVCVFFGFHLWTVTRTSISPGARIFLLLVILAKLVVVTTMGHIDISRFISFVKSFLFLHYVDLGTTNPWLFSFRNAHTDFPYPPLFLYLHTVAFLPFAKMLNLTPQEFPPNVLSYGLIRVPFLVFDYLFFRHFIARFVPADWPRFLAFFLSPVLLYSQYFSGQLDLIVVFFLFFALRYYEEENRKLFLVFLFLSLVFKPFAYIFLPLIAVDRLSQAGFREGFKLGLWIVLVVVLGRLFEIPYIFEEKYRAQMGGGARTFFEGVYLIPWPLFWPAYGMFLFYYYAKKVRDLSFGVVGVCLLVSVFVLHWPGWLVWFVPFFVVMKQPRYALPIYWIWGVVFVLKWGVDASSAFMDSYDVFAGNYLGQETKLGIGYFFRILESAYGEPFARNVETAIRTVFQIISFGFLAYLIRDRSFSGDGSSRSAPEQSFA